MIVRKLEENLNLDKTFLYRDTSAQSYINVLKLVDDQLWLGGRFDYINHPYDSLIKIVDPSTGKVLHSMISLSIGSISDMVVKDSFMYVSGFFNIKLS